MITSKLLKNTVGVQQNSIKDKTEISNLPLTTNAVIVGYFRRGVVNKPFKVTAKNYIALLGRDIFNPSYMAVEDVLNRGIEEIWVVRIIKSNNSDNPNDDTPQLLKPKYNGTVQANGTYKYLDSS